MSQGYSIPVAQSDADVRVQFIKRTYTHLAFAILAFAGLEFVLVHSVLAPMMLQMMGGGMSWLLVLGAFMFVSYIANKWAFNAQNLKMQYAGLGLYVIAEAVIFVPLLYIAMVKNPGVITMAAIFTMLIFGGLTFTAFTSGKDFTFLGGFLRIGGFVALGLIACSLLFNFPLPILLFSGAMICFASCAILYSTSNVMRHYHPGQHVAAALSLFASVALLFWYIVQFLMAMSND